MSIQDVKKRKELNQRQPDDIVRSRPDEETSELIAQRAYELYQQRGAQVGGELSDWLRAEIEVRKLPSRPEEIT